MCRPHPPSDRSEHYTCETMSIVPHVALTEPMELAEHQAIFEEILLMVSINQIDWFHSDNAVDVFDDRKKKKKKKKTVLMLFCVFVCVFWLLILLLKFMLQTFTKSMFFHGFPIPTSLGHLGPAGDRRCVGMPRLNPSAKFDVESEYSKHIWGVAVKCLGSRA